MTKTGSPFRLVSVWPIHAFVKLQCKGTAVFNGAFEGNWILTAGFTRITNFKWLSNSAQTSSQVTSI